MKIAIIDIGSNSVRLALLADGKTIYKRLASTRLGSGLDAYGRLNAQAIERTVKAICDFAEAAAYDGAEKVYAFGTAAVRSAANGEEFVSAVYKACKIEVDVVDGVREARLGILGAFGNADGGIIDVGGASTEVTYQTGGKTAYTHSVNVGTVRLFDAAGRDKGKLERIIEERVSQYPAFSSSLPVRAIGGTATRMAAIKRGVSQYTPGLTDGTPFGRDELYDFADKLLTAPVETIRANTICGDASDIIGGGCLLLAEIMRRFSIESITVSESDNIEGYAAALGVCN